MTRAETLFQEGADAFRAGVPRAQNPHWASGSGYTDWWHGWDCALAGKQSDYIDYRKKRALFEQKYVPLNYRGSASFLQDAQARRWSKIAHYELTYPEFKDTYDKHHGGRRA